MEIVIHRINTISQLNTIPVSYGTEIDIRANGSELILNHEPFQAGELLTDYLDNYKHGLLVLNIKEAGIEETVLAEVRKRNIPDFFLLDVEFPYLYRAARKGERAIAVRYSEDEPIELVKLYKDKVDWVWIDTNTRLPLTDIIVQELQGIKSCLVCPERWRRPEDISAYRKQMNAIGFEPTAVMTGIHTVSQWEALL